MRYAASFLFLVAVAWLAVIAFIYLSLASISTWVSSWTPVFYIALVLTGPVALGLGSSMVLLGREKLGTYCVIVSCLVLTAIVAHETILELKMSPTELQAPPPYMLYAALVGVTVLADICAFYLYRGISGITR